MKKTYQDLQMEVLLLCTQDIVALSENFSEDCGDDIFNPGDTIW